MAQSTEDYLDSLLRQAMGIPDPEPASDTVVQDTELSDGSNDVLVQDNNDAEILDATETDLFNSVDGIEEASDMVEQFMADDTPVSEDFVVPEASTIEEIPLTDITDFQLNEETPIESELEVKQETVAEVNDEVPQEAEEAPAEAPATMSIDDLDPANANQALSPDMIAALFAGANNDEAPAEAETNEETATDAIDEVPQEAEEAPAEAPATMSIDDLDPANANQALSPDMIAALFAGANNDEAPAEAETNQEAAAEVNDEVPQEAEETPAEAPATMSIDDLDPANANQALSPDMIAALFAGANNDEAPAEAETNEETATDAIDEVPQEVEEMPAEAPATMSIDDLDPANANEALSPDMIAALFAGAESDDNSQVADVNENSSDADLVEDEEISDLLNSIGEMDSITSADNQQNMEVGGLDLSDVDLGAMLDDVNNSSESNAYANDTESSLDDYSADDLNSLLNSLDSDADISDIGDMLSKDEKSELLDTDTGMLNSLFAADSDDALDLDSILDDSEDDNKKKKKKEKKKKDKKKKGLFGKKNNEEQLIDLNSDEELAIDPDSFDLPEKNENTKKKGFLGKFVDKLFEEVEEEEVVKGKLIEETPMDIAIEGAEINEQILKEVNDEIPEKKDKKGKKKKKSGDSESEDEESSKKKKKKEKKQKSEPEPELPMKKLPLKKVIMIFVLCISIGALVVLISLYYPYFTDMHNAKKYYASGDYESTYKYLSGHELDEEEQILFEKTVLILKPDRMYNSYLNYMKMGYKIEALNALVQGVQVIDEYGYRAEELGIADKFYSVEGKIDNALSTVFSVDVDTAREWYMLEGTPEYTRALYDYLYNLQPRDEEGNPIYTPQINSVEIMTNEENNI